MSVDTRTPAAEESTGSAPRTLTTWKIIVLIIAAMTPLSAIVGTIPLGLAFGGPSTALMFVIAGLIIALFCVGYVQMVRKISRPGAFYNYIARGIGRPAGVGAAMIAVVGYPVGLIATFAVQAFVAQETVSALFGVTLPWQVFLLVHAVIILFLAWRQIDLSAVVVLVIVVAEVVILSALVIAIALSLGADAFPLGAMSFEGMGVGQWTVAFVFAILCFQGYEAGAMYAPEAKRPSRTIPRALYGALAILVILLTSVSWALTGVSGVETGPAVVQEQGITGFIFTTVATYLGPVGLWLFSVLVLFAQIACGLAITNFMSRYLQSLAAEDLLPARLAGRNRHGAPGPAVLLLVGLGVVVVLVLSAIGVNPQTQITAVGFGIGALGATALQALASLAVVLYFLRQPASERHWWKTFLAPALSTVLLVIALIVELKSFTWITGSEDAWTTVIPWIIPIALIFGIGYGFWIRKNRPATYADLSGGDTAEEAAAMRDIRLANRASGTTK